MAAVKTEPFQFYFIGLLCSKYLQDEGNILTNTATGNEVLKKLRGQQLVTNISPF
jgi:CheY-like chemotaxis protein